MPRPTAANRDLLYRHYRANGGLLPYDVWLKHHRHEHPQQPAPGGWAVAVSCFVVLACALAALIALPVLHWMGKL